MEEWKREITERFQQWLDHVHEEPAAGPYPSDVEPPTPDIDSFFETLCVLQSDVGKNTRRTHEMFSRFAHTLEDLQGMLRSMADQLAEERRRHGRQALTEQRAFLTPYAEMLERLNRLEDRLGRPPKTGLLSARRKWAAAWSSFRDGFVLLREHFEQLLAQEGIVPMDTVGAPFDPSRMKAVATEESDDSHNVVLEELAAGYVHKGEVLKLAEVKVAVRKEER